MLRLSALRRWVKLRDEALILRAIPFLAVSCKELGSPLSCPLGAYVIMSLGPY